MDITTRPLTRPATSVGWRTNRRLHYALKMTVVYLCLAAGGFLVSVPFAWMLSTSLKTLGQTFVFPPIWVPVPLQWANYVKVFEVLPFMRYFINSV